MNKPEIQACLYKSEIEHLCKAHQVSAERHDCYVKSAVARNKPKEEKAARDAAQRHRNRIKELRQAGSQPDAAKTPEPSTLASAMCSAAPSELEKACVTLCVGDYWDETNHLKARIFAILQERGLMTLNHHGQMVIVQQNEKGQR